MNKPVGTVIFLPEGVVSVTDWAMACRRRAEMMVGENLERSVESHRILPKGTGARDRGDKKLGIDGHR